MLSVGIVALATGLTTAPLSRACSLEIPSIPTRAENPNYVVLRATADSASDGFYFATMSRDGLAREAASPGQRAIEVYGQVMEVISAAGKRAAALTPRRRVLVIWWELGASCQRAAPRAARHIAAGEVFLHLAPRDSTRSPSGLPTFDVSWGLTLVFAPGGGGITFAGDTARVMTMREFTEMFEVLPRTAAFERNPQLSVAPLLQWGLTKKASAAASPARHFICAARVMREQRFIPECSSGRGP